MHHGLQRREENGGSANCNALRQSSTLWEHVARWSDGAYTQISMRESRIAYLRSRGWSRQKIAEQVGAHYQTVVKWDRGIFQPTQNLHISALQRLVAYQQQLDAAAAAQITLEDLPDADHVV
mgnify:CR=1 FL=1